MLKLELTPKLDAYLGLLAKHHSDLKEEAELHRTQKSIPWSRLHHLYNESQSRSSERTVWLHELCQGSQMQLPSPPKRTKSKALQERLQMLQDRLDNQRYDEMVADLTVNEKKSEEMRNAVLPTFRLQASFGLHVIVSMGTFFAIGYYAGKLRFGSEPWAAFCGAMGLTFGMLLETTLFILRANRPAPLEERMPHLTDPHRQPNTNLGPAVKIMPHAKRAKQE